MVFACLIRWKVDNTKTIYSHRDFFFLCLLPIAAFQSDMKHHSQKQLFSPGFHLRQPILVLLVDSLPQTHHLDKVTRDK